MATIYNGKTNNLLTLINVKSAADGRLLIMMDNGKKKISLTLTPEEAYRVLHWEEEEDRNNKLAREITALL